MRQFPWREPAAALLFVLWKFSGNYLLVEKWFSTFSSREMIPSAGTAFFLHWNRLFVDWSEFKKKYFTVISNFQRVKKYYKWLSKLVGDCSNSEKLKLYLNNSFPLRKLSTSRWFPLNFQSTNNNEQWSATIQIPPAMFTAGKLTQINC